MNAELLAGADLAGRGIDFGGIGKDRLLEPFVYDAPIFEVEPALDSKDQQSDGRNCEQPDAQQKRCPGMFARAFCPSDS